MVRARGGGESDTPSARLLATALHLFYANGIRAVGVDRLIADAGVAKASFYAHYPSKQDLVDTYLKAWGEAWLEWLDEAMEGRSARPVEQLIGLFDALEDMARDRQFRGCAFTNALADAGGEANSVRKLARDHKKALAKLIETRAAAAGVEDPRAAAASAVLLIDGAMVGAARERSTTVVRHGREVFEMVLSGYPGPGSRSTP